MLAFCERLVLGIDRIAVGAQKRFERRGDDPNPTDVTPGMAASLSRISCCIRITRSGSLAMASGIMACRIWISSGCVNPGCTLRKC